MVEFRYARGRIPESVRYVSEEILEFETDYALKTWQEYQEDKKLQKLIDRTVENILTALIEVCGTFLVEQGLAPDNYADVLKTCASRLGLAKDEQDGLASLAVQRNRLAHRYLDFRWQAVKEFSSRKETVKKLLTRVLESEAQKLDHA